MEFAEIWLFENEDTSTLFEISLNVSHLIMFLLIGLRSNCVDFFDAVTQLTSIPRMNYILPLLLLYNLVLISQLSGNINSGSNEDYDIGEDFNNETNINRHRSSSFTPIVLGF